MSADGQLISHLQTLGQPDQIKISKLKKISLENHDNSAPTLSARLITDTPKPIQRWPRKHRNESKHSPATSLTRHPPPHHPFPKSSESPAPAMLPALLVRWPS